MESPHPRELESSIHVKSGYDSRFDGGVISPHFIGPADSLKTPRKIQITGALSGEANFDGTTDISINLSSGSSGPTGGIVIPWYIYPSNASLGTDTVLNNFLTLRQQYPAVPVHVIINPNNGPGTTTEADYQGLITSLKAANCTVLGYVPTTWGARAASLVKADVNKYLTLYTGVDGIFYDEASCTDSQTIKNYYVDITTFAHSKPLSPVYLNAGTGVPDSFYSVQGMFDYIVVFENNRYPTTGEITTPAGANRDVRSVMVYNNQLNTQAVESILSGAKMVYISDCGAGYDTLPTYLSNLFSLCSGGGSSLVGSNLVLTTSNGSYTVSVDGNGKLCINGTPVSTGGSSVDPVTSITTNTTITVNEANKEYFFLVSNGVTLTLPTAVNNQARYNVKSLVGSCTVNTVGGETIDGDTSVTLTEMNSISFKALGGSWWCF